jgi:drug/metabolite transporter (DMT)-like permease
MVVVLAVLAACFYGVASVLQHRAAVEAPRELSMRFGLLTRLARKPLWLCGMATDAGGYIFEASALAIGSLALVEPMVVLGLPLALVIGGLWSRRPLRPNDWIGVVAVTAGIAVFVSVTTPSPGKDFATGAQWAVAGAIAVAVAGGILVLARRLPRWRATLYATATGCVQAFTTGLTKSTASLVKDHALAALSHWEPYALVVVGLVGIVMSQSSYQAGELRASLPALTLTPPLISILIGLFLFSEHINTSPVAIVLAVLSALVAGAGVVSLGHSTTLVEVAYATGDE